MAHTVTIRDETIRLKDHLAGIYDPPELESVIYLILEEYLCQSRLFIRTNPDWPVPRNVLSLLDHAISRLKDHVPVQYVLGKAHFYGMKLMVNEHVLIPRPETEELVDWIRKDYIPDSSGLSLKILDIGTGSGCIAIALKRLLPASIVEAIDTSIEALRVARSNARSLDTDITFRKADILDTLSCSKLGVFDLIVSNPPYVLASDRAHMKPNVLRYEPVQALYVDDSRPLVHYEAIAAFSVHHLKYSGTLYLEIHERMGQSIMDLFRQYGFAQINLKQDIHNKTRMVRINRRAEAGNLVNLG